MDVKKIAFLSRLIISEEQEKKETEQLPLILKYFEQISEVNTEGVEPLVTPTDIDVYLRPDKAQKWDQIEKALENAPDLSGHLFKVPPVV